MRKIKTLLQTVCVAFSLYSRIPMPQILWDAANLRYAMCALPLVGAAAGLAMLLWNLLAVRLNLGPSLWAAGLLLEIGRAHV